MAYRKNTLFRFLTAGLTLLVFTYVSTISPFIGDGSFLNAASSIDVWWPVENAKIDGAQPFKALLRDTDVSNYEMFWQVDNGKWNKMENNERDWPHKEAGVDVSNWTWHESRPYEIKFIAQQSGTIVEERTIHIVVENKTNASKTSDSESNTDGVSAPDTSQNEVVSTSESSRTADTAASPSQQLRERILSHVINQINGGDSPTPSPIPAPASSPSPSPTPTPAPAPAPRSTPVPDSPPNPKENSTSNPSPAPTPVPAPTATPDPKPVPPPPTSAPSNPLDGVRFYVNKDSKATEFVNEWKNSRPADANLMSKIASGAESVWLGDWSDIPQDISSVISKAQSAGEYPVFIAYNIPGRDCGGYSAGGVGSSGAYRDWINSIVNTIGNNKAAVVIEPDALSNITCLSPSLQSDRLDLIGYAVRTLKAKPNITVYVDAGNPGWLPAETIAPRLQSAHVAEADGFAINISNFYTTADNIRYGEAISRLIGNKHFIIDTSRNGAGSNGEWCNPSGRALGQKPTSQTNNALIDALLWLKKPGESDGTCHGGPTAGVWWTEYALGLASRASW